MNKKEILFVCNNIIYENLAKNALTEYDIKFVRDIDNAKIYLQSAQPSLVVIDNNSLNGKAAQACPEIRNYTDCQLLLLSDKEKRAQKTTSATKNTLSIEKNGNEFAMLRKILDKRINIPEKNTANKTDKYYSIFQSVPNPIIGLNKQGVITDCNLRVKDTLGYEPDEIIGLNFSEALVPNPLQYFENIVEALCAKKEYKIKKKNGEIIDININASHDDNGRILCIIDDITEHKRAAAEIELSHKFIKIIHDYTELQPIYDEFVRVIKNFTECSAVGIRMLEDDGRIPFIAHKGLNADFLDKENKLSIHTDQSCCVYIIRGDADFDHACHTEDGAFYSNDTYSLLKKRQEEENPKQGHICTKHGYRSVVLVPIKIENRISGILFIADERKNMASLWSVKVLEFGAIHLGMAIERIRAEKRLAANYECQKTLNNLLSIPIDNLPIDKLLAQILEIVLSAPFLSLESKGGIFLAEKEELFMTTQSGLPGNIINMCGRVPFGRCLCGRAASEKQLQFAACVDHRHENSYEGMQPHGHYCVPILSRDQAIGVLDLYLKHGHKYSADEASFLTAVANTIAGIIERKRIEDAIMKASQEWKQTFDAVPDLIMVIDTDYKIASMNKAAASRLGVRIEDAVGKKCNTFGVSWFDCLQNKKWEANDKSCIKEFHDTDANIDYIGMVSPVGYNNKIMNYVLVMHDITEQKKLHSKVIEAQKMDSIGNLAGGIAHDFNNMLSGIQGYASLLQMKETDPKKKEFVHGIIDIVGESASLIEKLLAFGRKGKNIIKAVNINDKVNNVYSILKCSIDKSIRIEMLLDKEPCYIDGDPSQMNQVIMNLCVNAVESMPDGGNLSIRTENVLLSDKYSNMADIPPGKYVSLSVTDTGCGIPKDIQGKIFDPFFTTKKNGKVQGTGLGLSTVYGIVANHGGTVTVYSEPGHGSIFKIFLPVGVKEHETIPENKFKTIKSGTGKVLIIDDEAHMRITLKAMLEEMGYSVITAEDGEIAISLYEKQFHDIDMVIIDMIMPKIDGKKTFEKLIAINPDIKALLCSGYALDGRAQEILDIGVKAFLHKPYDIWALSEKLNQLQI